MTSHSIYSRRSLQELSAYAAMWKPGPLQNSAVERHRQMVMINHSHLGEACMTIIIALHTLPMKFWRTAETIIARWKGQREMPDGNLLAGNQVRRLQSQPSRHGSGRGKQNCAWLKALKPRLWPVLATAKSGKLTSARGKSLNTRLHFFGHNWRPRGE